MSPGVAIGISYVAGSIPFAYLAGRAFGGIDLRQHGSGNLGATNVYRALGLPAALAVFPAVGVSDVWHAHPQIPPLRPHRFA